MSVFHKDHKELNESYLREQLLSNEVVPRLPLLEEFELGEKEFKLNAYHFEALKLIKNPKNENKSLRFTLTDYLKFLRNQGGISVFEFDFLVKFNEVRNTLIHCRVNHSMAEILELFKDRRIKFLARLNEYSYRTRGQLREIEYDFEEFIETGCLFLIGMFREAISILLKRRSYIGVGTPFVSKFTV